MNAPAHKVTIKKYANRRLYDTESSTYVTLDRWVSRAAYEEFRIVHAAAYAALDESTTGLTLAERHLGTFYG